MFPQRDQQLLAEAYSLQLLKESFPRMTLKQVLTNLDEFSGTEKVWVEEFSERIITELIPEQVVLEFWSGAKGVGKSFGNAISKGAKNLGQGIANKASQVGQGVKSAASQVGQNIKDVYDSSEDEAKFKKGATRAKEAAVELAELIKDAQAKGLITFSQDPMTMPLGDLVDELLLAQKGSSQLAKSSQKRSPTEGIGKAFQRGYQGA